MNKKVIEEGAKTLRTLAWFTLGLVALAVIFHVAGDYAGNYPKISSVVVTIGLTVLSFFLYRFKKYGKWGYGVIELIFGFCSLGAAIYIGISGKTMMPDNAEYYLRAGGFILSLLAPMYILVRGFENVTEGWADEKANKSRARLTGKTLR